MPNIDDQAAVYVNYAAPLFNDNEIRVVEYVDLPADNDPPLQFHNRGSFNEYLATVNDGAVIVNDSATRIVYDDPPADVYNGPDLNDGDPNYFSFTHHYDGITRDDDGTYLVNRLAFYHYGERTNDHSGLIDDDGNYFYRFDHNPFTCGNRCQPRPAPRIRVRPRTRRRNPVGISEASHLPSLERVPQAGWRAPVPVPADLNSNRPYPHGTGPPVRCAQAVEGSCRVCDSQERNYAQWLRNRVSS